MKKIILFLVVMMALPCSLVAEKRLGVAPIFGEKDLPPSARELVIEDKGRNFVVTVIGQTMRYMPVSKDMQSRYILCVKWLTTRGAQALQGKECAVAVDLRVLLYDTTKQRELWRETITGYAVGEIAYKSKLLQGAWRNSVQEVAKKVALKLREDRVRAIHSLHHGALRTDMGTVHGLQEGDILKIYRQDEELIGYYRVAQLSKESCWAQPDLSQPITEKVQVGMIVKAIEEREPSQEWQQRRQKAMELLKNGKKISFGPFAQYITKWQRPGTDILTGKINKTRFKVNQEAIAIDFRVKQEGYIYILNITNNEQFKMVLPLVGYPDNKVYPGKPYSYPYADKNFPFYPEDFVMLEPGQEMFLVVWSEKPIASLQAKLESAYQVARQKARQGEDYEILVPLGSLDLQPEHWLTDNWDTLYWQVEAVE